MPCASSERIETEHGTLKRVKFICMMHWSCLKEKALNELIKHSQM